MELNLTHEQINAIRIIEAIGTIKIDYNCKLCLPTKDCIKCSKYKPKIIRWKCRLCGRDKFTRKSPHRCNTGFRKRHIIWEAIYECECNNLAYVESRNSHICLDCNKEYPESFFNEGWQKV